MYIRVKRSKTTYFVQCDPTEKILDIKQKLHALIDQPVSDQRLILMQTGDVLDDSKTLADQKVLAFFLPYIGSFGNEDSDLVSERLCNWGQKIAYHFFWV